MTIPTTSNLGLAKPGQGVTGWNTYHVQNYEDIDSIFGDNHDESGHHEVVTIDEQSSTPSTPTAGTEANLYMKDDKLILQFDHSGTVKYFYLNLTAASNQQWQYTTSAP